MLVKGRMLAAMRLMRRNELHLEPRDLVRSGPLDGQLKPTQEPQKRFGSEEIGTKRYGDLPGIAALPISLAT
jgi:hypothetical protein